jgi:hypothetical protein
MLSVTYKPLIQRGVMMNAAMLSVVMLNVVALKNEQNSSLKKNSGIAFNL